jgi:hypothetical protein
MRNKMELKLMTSKQKLSHDDVKALDLKMMMMTAREENGISRAQARHRGKRDRQVPHYSHDSHSVYHSYEVLTAPTTRAAGTRRERVLLLLPLGRCKASRGADPRADLQAADPQDGCRREDKGAHGAARSQGGFLPASH